jgi:hypothetical protein
VWSGEVLPHSIAAATYSGPGMQFMIRTIGNLKSPRWRASLKPEQ